MKPNNIIELITSFLKYNFLKKSDLEKLKKSDKAKSKKYLNIFENSLYTKIVHECDKDIKFENSDIRELNLLRSDGFVKLENFKFEFDRAYYHKILDDRNLSTYDQIGVSSVNDASKHFKDLGQILESQHINNLCKSYLGDDVTLNHIRVERLEKKLSRKDVSGRGSDPGAGEIHQCRNRAAGRDRRRSGCQAGKWPGADAARDGHRL